MDKTIAIRTENLSKQFGAVQAVKGVSLSVPQGEMHAIIGPNGAGKSTFMDLIINKTTPTSGRTFLFDEEITGKPPHVIAGMGLNKCFQISQFFPQLTCCENIAIALLQRERLAYSFRPVGKNFLRESCEKELAHVGIADLMDERACYLSYGDQRCLEIAITLALQPKVLFLDEPTAGVARAECYSIMDMIQRLNKDEGYTILFVEHDMDIVFNYSDMISVMNQGSLVASDTPDNIVHNEFVKKAYLGGGK